MPQEYLAGNLANAHFPLSGDVNLCYSDLLYDGEESDISASMPGLMSVPRSHCQHLGEHNEIEKDLKKILTEMQVITNKMKNDGDDKKVSAKWKYAAMVMDRFCLVLFVLFTTILSMVVFISAHPNVIVK